MAHAAASSFSLEGDLVMDFFVGQKDAYQVRINGERIETVIARMLGFPSEVELDETMQSEMSPDSSQPDIVRSVGKVHLSMHLQCDDGPF